MIWQLSKDTARVKEQLSERISNGETAMFIEYLNGNRKIIAK